MGKRKTLAARARAYGDRAVVRDFSSFSAAWLAGHRANRISAAERRVVEAAENWDMRKPGLGALRDAIEALQRAKGGANG